MLQTILLPLPNISGEAILIPAIQRRKLESIEPIKPKLLSNTDGDVQFWKENNQYIEEYDEVE